LYDEPLTGMTNAVFFTAYTPKADQIASGNFSQTINPWLLLKQSYVVEYPILVYTTPHPKHNTLMLANVSKNIPCKKIQLDVNFICFVGIDDTDTEDKKYTCIYFLAHDFN
jgi:hypothetical protein